MQVRCKFALTSIVTYAGSSMIEAVFTPQYDMSIPEDRRFQKASPWGEIKIRIDNPPVVEFYKGMLGKTFYFDCTEAPVPVPAA